jgi:hypothetical protein
MWVMSMGEDRACPKLTLTAYLGLRKKTFLGKVYRALCGTSQALEMIIIFRRVDF